MSLSESDTRSKLIDPKLYKRGWTEEHIRREETAGTIIIAGAKGKRRMYVVKISFKFQLAGRFETVTVGPLGINL
jgi:type I site-specific restriction endonuclease